MNSELPTIEDVERRLAEGNLDSITVIPPCTGSLPNMPKLLGGDSLVVEYPRELARHAEAWARMKRAVRDAQRPNHYRINRPVRPDPEFLVRNVTYLALRHLRIPCAFNWMVSENFRQHLTVIPAPEDQGATTARSHIYLPARKVWSLLVHPCFDIREPLTIAEYQIFSDASNAATVLQPWQSHAALIYALINSDRPFDRIYYRGWTSAEELARGSPTERTYDYVDRKGNPRIGKIACRKIGQGKMRPMLELLPLLQGWDKERLLREGRLVIKPCLGAGG